MAAPDRAKSPPSSARSGARHPGTKPSLPVPQSVASPTAFDHIVSMLEEILPVVRKISAMLERLDTAKGPVARSFRHLLEGGGDDVPRGTSVPRLFGKGSSDV